MWLISITKSERKNKKYVAKFCLCDKKLSCKGTNMKLVHFGADGYEDYTIHKDKKRKELYLLRHNVNEDWSNPLTAGSLSRYILWNLPSLKDSIVDFKKRFNL